MPNWLKVSMLLMLGVVIGGAIGAAILGVLTCLAYRFLLGSDFAFFLIFVFKLIGGGILGAATGGAYVFARNGFFKIAGCLCLFGAVACGLWEKIQYTPRSEFALREAVVAEWSFEVLWAVLLIMWGIKLMATKRHPTAS